MARVAVVTSHPPFVEGGHLVVARALVTALREAGHAADLVLTPQNRFGRQAAAYLATWLTDLGVTADGAPIDQVISLRFPSYAVRHPVHVCWLNHRMREYYDLWPEFRATLSWKHRIKEGGRRALVHAVDRYLLTRNVRRVLAQSRTVQERLWRWGRIPAEVLYPPPPPRPYRCDGYGDYIFAVSRLVPLKRLDLLVEALARPEAAAVRCVIAGDGPERAALARLIGERGVGDRVALIGPVSETALVDHLARCRAVCFPARAEDYGLVTVEAFAAAKPVVTCLDSGGPAELVVSGETGFVCAPTPDAVAVAVARLMADRVLAERMGAAAARRVAALTWENTVARLMLV
jgi:glycosyltransferase involved in cell wall biosynthesis